MNRSDFIKNVAVLGAMPFVISKAGAEGKKSSNKTKNSGFILPKKIFKIGRNKLSVALPEAYKDKTENLQLSLLCGDGAWLFKEKKPSFAGENALKFEVADGKLSADADFERECRYTLLVKDKTIKIDKAKKNRLKNIVAAFPLYALKPDLYALAPFKGDSHIHSTNSDGKNKPQEVALRCYEVGLDYQAISDHKTYETSQDMKNLFAKFPTSMSFLNAEECHESYVHVHNFGGNQSVSNYIKNNRAEFEKSVEAIKNTLPRDLPDSVISNVAIAEAEFDLIRRFGGIAVLNHPFWYPQLKGKFVHLESGILNLLSDRKKYDAYEYINSSCGHVTASMAANHYPYHAAPKPIMGCSDAHRVEMQGTGYTIVFAKNSCFDELKKSILSNLSVAAYELETKTKKCVFIFGDNRLADFAYFLLDEYFPEHDDLIAREGKLIESALKENSSDFSEIEKISSQVKKMYDSARG